MFQQRHCLYWVVICAGVAVVVLLSLLSNFHDAIEQMRQQMDVIMGESKQQQSVIERLMTLEKAKVQLKNEVEVVPSTTTQSIITQPTTIQSTSTPSMSTLSTTTMMVPPTTTSKADIALQDTQTTAEELSTTTITTAPFFQTTTLTYRQRVQLQRNLMKKKRKPWEPIITANDKKLFLKLLKVSSSVVLLHDCIQEIWFRKNLFAANVNVSSAQGYHMIRSKQ